MLTYSSRRDGTPFLNLLMVAPLYDNRGAVRYFIGAQVDVSGLVEGGRGIESFERLLSDDELHIDQQRALGSELEGSKKAKAPLEHLAELGQMFSYEECNTVQSVSRSNSLRDEPSLKGTASRSIGTGKPGAPISRLGNRRVLGDEPKPEDDEKNNWGLSATTLSGRLPGVYHSVRLSRYFRETCYGFGNFQVSRQHANHEASCGIANIITVPFNSPVSGSPHHFCISIFTHSRPSPIALSLAHWRP